MPHYRIHNELLKTNAPPGPQEYEVKVFEAAKRDLREGRATVAEDGYVRGYFPLKVRHDDPGAPQAEDLCAFLRRIGVRYLFGFYDGGWDHGMLSYDSVEIDGERLDTFELVDFLGGILTSDYLYPLGLSAGPAQDSLCNLLDDLLRGFVVDLGFYLLGLKSWDGAVTIRGAFRFDVVTGEILDIE